MPPRIPAEVSAILAGYPPAIRKRLKEIRRLLFDVAASVDGVGPITETLKWREPAYLTAETKSGSTVRLGWKAATPTQYRVLFNCQTDLVSSFRDRFGEDLEFEGNRAILLDQEAPLPEDVLRLCLEAALTYHRR